MTETVSAFHTNGSGHARLMPAMPNIDTSVAVDGLRLHGGTKLTNDLRSSGIGLASPTTPTRSRSRRSDTVSELPSFMVSAPGKVIVYGEHAVVHGKVSSLPLGVGDGGVLTIQHRVPSRPPSRCAPTCS